MSQSYIQHDQRQGIQLDASQQLSDHYNAIQELKYQQIQQKLKQQAFNDPIGRNNQYSQKELQGNFSQPESNHQQETYQQHIGVIDTANQDQNYQIDSYQQQSHNNHQSPKHQLHKRQQRQQINSQSNEIDGYQEIQPTRQQHILSNKIFSNYKLMKYQTLEALKLSKLAILNEQIKKCKRMITQRLRNRRKRYFQQRVGSLKQISSQNSSMSSSDKFLKIKSYRSRAASPEEIELMQKIKQQKKLDNKLNLIALQIDNKLKIKKKQYKKTFYKDDHSQQVSSIIDNEYQLGSHKILIFQNENQRKYHELLVKKYILLKKTIQEQKQHFANKKELLQQQTEIMRKQLQYVLMETQKKKLVLKEYKDNYKQSLEKYRLRKFRQKDQNIRKKKFTPSIQRKPKPLIRPMWKIQGINVNKKNKNSSSKDKKYGNIIGYSPQHKQKVQYQYFNKPLRYKKQQYDNKSQRSSKSSKAKSLSGFEENNRFLY